MKLGLVLIGILLVAGGIAGLRQTAPYLLVEPRSAALDLPSDAGSKPLDVRPVNLRLASWASIAIGGVVIGGVVIGAAWWSRRLRVPEPHHRPPDESLPYI